MKGIICEHAKFLTKCKCVHISSLIQQNISPMLILEGSTLQEGNNLLKL